MPENGLRRQQFHCMQSQLGITVSLRITRQIGEPANSYPNMIPDAKHGTIQTAAF
jgi:hypothetical protein